MRISNHGTVFGMIVSRPITACSSDGITGANSPASLSSPVASSLSVERPWRGECDVAAQFISELTLQISGSCQLAHIGRATVIAFQTIVPGPSGIAYTNTAVYTSADGDELRTTNIGLAIPNADGLSLSGIETAVGGTGRFAGASGTAVLAGAVRFTGPSTTIGSYTLEGRLTY
jgi:hypothetical protein